MSPATGRRIDHIVMPVASLAEGRGLLERLGFTVAPDAKHPFGTGNACVFFADATYLEPLAVLDRELAETEAAKGNAFLRRDLAYRLRHDLPGFTGVAIASDDAAADHAAFVEAGFGGGDLLEFGRSFENATGERTDLAFRLAFATHPNAPESFVFACQRLSSTGGDRSAFTRHPNGARGLDRLVYAAADPEAVRTFVEAALGRPAAVVSNSLGFSLTVANAVIDVLSPDGLLARYGVTDAARSGLKLVGAVLRTASPEQAASFARTSGAAPFELLGRHVVPLPGATGTFLAFEPASA